MNKIFSKSLAVVALVATVAFVGAQGTPGQGGQGQGRGQGRGFGGQFGQRGGGQSELQVALRKDVQADLGVTADQKTKLDELQAKLRAARGQGAPGGQGGQGRGQGGGFGQMTEEQRAAMQKQMEEQRAQQHKELAAILNDGQLKRLGEIALQLQGNRALTQKSLQEKLGFTKEQQDKVQSLMDKSREASQALMEKMRSQELTREEAQATMQKNTQILNEELGRVLTEAQAAKYKEMQGKPFKADPNENQGRRGGGGGGGF